MVIGLSLGFAVRVVFAAVEFAGEVIGLQMGLNFAGFFDPVTAADRLSEERMREVLARRRPMDGILGEELRNQLGHLVDLGRIAAQTLDLVEVGAGAEVLALGPNEHRPDPRPRRLELVERRRNRAMNRKRQAVELVRPRQLDDAHRAVAAYPYRAGAAHLRFSAAYCTAMRPARSRATMSFITCAVPSPISRPITSRRRCWCGRSMLQP